MIDHTHGPRVFVPPPLVFVGSWLVAWGLSRRVPFEIDGAGASLPQRLVGLLLVGGGLGLMFWAFATFARARTPVIPVKPARVIVSDGPFRFSRNPMYLGLTAAYLGLAAFFNQAWPVVLLPVALIVLSAFVIDREEQIPTLRLRAGVRCLLSARQALGLIVWKRTSGVFRERGEHPDIVRKQDGGS